MKGPVLTISVWCSIMIFPISVGFANWEVAGKINEHFSDNCPRESLSYGCCEWYTHWYQIEDSFDGEYDVIDRALDEETWAIDFYQHPLFNSYWDNMEPFGIAWADVGFYYGHGGKSIGNGTSYYAIYDQNNCNSCRAYTKAPPEVACDGLNNLKMQFGNDDMNAFFGLACNTLNHEVFINGDYYQMKKSGWNWFTVYGGFHGIREVGPDDMSWFDDWLDDSFSNDMPDNFIYYMTDWVIGGNNDDCAMVAIWAESQNAAFTALNHTGFLDWLETGSDVLWGWWLSDCNPDDGDPLP